MRAMVLPRFGGPEVFEERELPDPVPCDGQVLIRVAASSVNPVDYKIRDGRAAALAGPLPAILHPDCAGEVVAVGSGVDGFRPGDRVIAFASGLAGKAGALADLMVADARMVARKPGSLSFEQAAALPLVTVTAWYALVDQAGVGPGHGVLIEGGTGGVGHVAVQLAAARGATVFAMCGSAETCAIAEDLGATRTFNYKTTEPAEVFAAAPGGAGFDVVFNTPGAASIDHAVAAARHGGTILDILGDFPTRPGFQMKWLSFRSVFAGRPIVQNVDQAGVGSILAEAGHLVDQGSLKPLVDRQRFAFAQVGAAHSHAEFGSPTGKVVLSR